MNRLPKGPARLHPVTPEFCDEPSFMMPPSPKAAENRCKGRRLLYAPGSWLPVDMLLLAGGRTNTEWSFRLNCRSRDTPPNLPEPKLTKPKRL